MSDSIIICGASARAAAFSALHAGLTPYCVDLFADRDLTMHCHCQRIDNQIYPQGFPEMVQSLPDGPWMYVGGLENDPTVIEEISKERTLWGNGPEVLKKVRSPEWLSTKLNCPEIDLEVGHKGWLRKSRKSAGGQHIEYASEGEIASTDVYFQEWIEGQSYSASFSAIQNQVELIGITEQLVGTSWLHAKPFAYTGSIGPVQLGRSVQAELEKMGQFLVKHSGICGLFGIDFILHNGIPRLIEVNPRYTASMEVLEYAGVNIAAKAILWASHSFRFPEDGPWMESLKGKWSMKMPKFADIPYPGAEISINNPILTFFSSADSYEKCYSQIRKLAVFLDSQWPE